jgi:hypothetical protein
MILAIVGTRRFPNPKGLVYAELIIVREITSGEWDGIVTGDAPGIDQLVWDTCENLEFPCDPLAPRHRRWDDDGFKARNILIGQTCDELLCIRDPESMTYGSGWTADYTQALGKPVTRVTIS